MDRVAVQAWREAKDCLGRSYDVDLYENVHRRRASQKPANCAAIRQKASVAVVTHLSPAARAKTPLVVGTPVPSSKAPAAASNIAIPVNLRIH